MENPALHAQALALMQEIQEVEKAIQSFWGIRNKATREIYSPRGVSTAPHLYRTKGIADARRKQLWKADEYEVVEILMYVVEPEI